MLSLIRSTTTKPLLTCFFLGAIFSERLSSVQLPQPSVPSLELLSVEKLTNLRGVENAPLNTVIREIERSLAGGDPTYLDSILDQDSILHRATGAESPAEETEIRQIFHTGTRQAWERSSPAADLLGQELRFLRVHSINNVPGLLFRAVAANGSLNYHLFSVTQPEPGKFLIGDMFSLGINEFTSQTLNRTYAHLVEHFVRQTDTVSTAYVEALPEIAKINRALSNQNGDAALDVIEHLPAELQKDRSILMMKLDAAQAVSKTHKHKALGDWKSVFPDETELPLRWAESYMDSQRWAEAKDLLQVACDKVGGDSYLQFQIGQLALQMRPKAMTVTAVLPVR